MLVKYGEYTVNADSTKSIYYIEAVSDVARLLTLSFSSNDPNVALEIYVDGGRDQIVLPTIQKIYNSGLTSRNDFGVWVEKFDATNNVYSIVFSRVVEGGKIEVRFKNSSSSSVTVKVLVFIEGGNLNG